MGHLWCNASLAAASSLSAYTSGYLQERWHIISVKTQAEVVTITVLQQNIGDEVFGYMHAGFNKF